MNQYSPMYPQESGGLGGGAIAAIIIVVILVLIGASVGIYFAVATPVSTDAQKKLDDAAAQKNLDDAAAAKQAAADLAAKQGTSDAAAKQAAADLAAKQAADLAAAQKAQTTGGTGTSCYGAKADPCNTCDDVVAAYTTKNWAYDKTKFSQCAGQERFRGRRERFHSNAENFHPERFINWM